MSDETPIEPVAGAFGVGLCVGVYRTYWGVHRRRVDGTWEVVAQYLDQATARSEALRRGGAKEADRG